MYKYVLYIIQMLSSRLCLIFCRHGTAANGRGADLVVAETESEANIIRGTALDAIFELQVNQATGRGMTGVSEKSYTQMAIVSKDFNGENDDAS